MEGSATAKRGWETMLRESSCEIAILEKLLRRRERRRGRPRGRRLVGEPGEKRKEGRKGVGRKEGGMDGWMWMKSSPWNSSVCSALPSSISHFGGNKLVGCPCPESRIPIWTRENHTQLRKNKNSSMPQNFNEWVYTRVQDQRNFKIKRCYWSRGKNRNLII